MNKYVLSDRQLATMGTRKEIEARGATFLRRDHRMFLQEIGIGHPVSTLAVAHIVTQLEFRGRSFLCPLVPMSVSTKDESDGSLCGFEEN